MGHSKTKEGESNLSPYPHPTRATLAHCTGSCTLSHADTRRVKARLLPPPQFRSLLTPLPSLPQLFWDNGGSRWPAPSTRPSESGTTHESAAASKSSPAGSLPRSEWGGHRATPTGCGAKGHSSTSAHIPPTQHPVSPERKEALEEPEHYGSASDLLRVRDHQRTVGPQGAETLVLSGCRQSCRRDEALQGLEQALRRSYSVP